MHPNPAFRSEDHALMLSLVEEIGMVFAAPPDGDGAMAMAAMMRGLM